jgi:hypothetical protein
MLVFVKCEGFPHYQTFGIKKYFSIVLFGYLVSWSLASLVSLGSYFSLLV